MSTMINILKDITYTVDFSFRKRNRIHKKVENIDFYKRFAYRMKYMMRVGKEKGYNLMSFMGP